ncbi:MAG TPA: molybdopterin-synthase adenylyltransferase MoeB [bacterium]|nr:molybdopterin-synthase adenylyltransferase MoeB [bacterium]
MLDDNRRKRYSRHLILPQVGEAGQEKLLAASVLVVGAGGLGSPVIYYLAAAGVGRIGVVDSDVVDVSNLQRQILHGTGDVGRLKVESARARIAELNPDVEMVPIAGRAEPDNVMGLIEGYDVVVDACDNFPTRYLVNDACVLQKKPFVYGSVYQFEGQASVFSKEGGPCYRCMFPDPPDSDLVADESDPGILGVVPGVIGNVQAAETIKLIVGTGESLSGRFLLFDALKMRFNELSIKRDPDCRVCGDSPGITEIDPGEVSYN